MAGSGAGGNDHTMLTLYHAAIQSPGQSVGEFTRHLRYMLAPSREGEVETIQPVVGSLEPLSLRVDSFLLECGSRPAEEVAAESHEAEAQAPKVRSVQVSGLGRVANTAASFMAKLTTIAKLVDCRRLAAIMALACGIATP
jgi:hypothetical protein